MDDLDRWAREHRHRIKRAQIAKIRASRAELIQWGLGAGLDKQTIWELRKNGFVEVGQVSFGSMG